MEIIVLLGAPGSGKGTAAAHLGTESNLRHVSTGALCREALAQGTAWGEAIRPYMDRGELVPDALVLERVGEVLEGLPTGERVLFDGFPRTPGQAQVFEDLLGDSGWRLRHVILLDVAPATLEERLGARMGCEGCGTIYNLHTRAPRVAGICDACGAALSQRGDDQLATIRRRIQVYEDRTAPLVRYYQERGLLRRIDAGKPADEVARQIRDIVDRDGQAND